MRFHLVGLPHTQVTDAYSACAFTTKVDKFAKMMMGLGHEVYLYAGEQNEAPCTEHIVCISEKDRIRAIGGAHYSLASFDPRKPHWVTFNSNVIAGVRERAKPTDFICIIGGNANKAIADALPNMMVVEFGIGYGGTFAKYRVWESYAWMHTCYGAATNNNPNAADGVWFDEVIPSYFEPEKFPLRNTKDDYYLFMGRLTERKGYKIAEEVCKHLGKRLIVAGQGTPPEYGEYVGVVDPKKRGRLMAGAIACFVPTIYVEPFGSVAPEAMLCGTPVISTDWGAMTETVVQGVTGFRCRSFAEFLKAAEDVKQMIPAAIRQHAIERYSLDVVAKQYDAYFKRLSTLWGDGWYALGN